MNKVFGLHKHKCVQCGNEFECTASYRYKKYNRKVDSGADYYCSYSCMRDAERERDERKKKAV